MEKKTNSRSLISFFCLFFFLLNKHEITIKLLWEFRNTSLNLGATMAQAGGTGCGPVLVRRPHCDNHWFVPTGLKAPWGRDLICRIHISLRPRVIPGKEAVFYIL